MLLPYRKKTMKIAATVKQRVKEMKTSPVNDFMIMKMKKIITPPHISQKKACSAAGSHLTPSLSIIPNIMDMVIRETGNEKPRKKTSSVSFSK